VCTQARHTSEFEVATSTGASEKEPEAPGPDTLIGLVKVAPKSFERLKKISQAPAGVLSSQVTLMPPSWPTVMAPHSPAKFVNPEGSVERANGLENVVPPSVERLKEIVPAGLKFGSPSNQAT